MRPDKWPYIPFRRLYHRLFGPTSLPIGKAHVENRVKRITTRHNCGLMCVMDIEIIEAGVKVDCPECGEEL